MPVTRRPTQLALPLGEVPVSESRLRLAFAQCRARVSFEEAMKWNHFRIALRHLALPSGRRRT